MKIISFGYIDRKFLLYSSIYIVIILTLNTISMILKNIDDSIKKILKNIPVMLIIIHGSLIFAIIFECYLRKSVKTKMPNKEIKNDEENKNGIVYIYNEPKKENVKENFFLLILMIILDYIYDGGLMFFQKNLEDSELVYGEIFKFLDVLFLLIFFRLFHKILFYRHQYISLFIILFMGLGKFLVILLYEEKYNNLEKNFDYFSIIAMIVFPLFDSTNIYFFQKFIIYNYYTPYYICFLIGIIYLIISIPIIIVFSIIDCGNSDICKLFSNKDIEFPNFGQVILFIFYSLFYSAQHFIKLLTLNNFTVFHLILIVTFGELINGCFKFPDFSSFDLVTSIIVNCFEIFGVLVFTETIELSFCGLNINLKRNIMFRAGNEVNLIDKQKDENESNGTSSDGSDILKASENSFY